jgi:hypothetical protein
MFCIDQQNLLRDQPGDERSIVIHDIDEIGQIHAFLQDGALPCFSVQLLIAERQWHSGCDWLPSSEVQNGLLMALWVLLSP